MQEVQTFSPIKIRYQPLPLDPVTLWPLVEIELSKRGRKFPQKILALVDSGANISILHPDIAAAIGFQSSDLRFVQGGKSVSGNYNSALVPHEITVSIYGYSFSTRFTVVNNPHLAFACILGEDSIFQWARLDFSRFKGFFEIKFQRDLH